jgi:hypothetical protein
LEGQLLDKEREYKMKRLVHLKTCKRYEKKLSEMREALMGNEEGTGGVKYEN